jgi:hypothetical protein
MVSKETIPSGKESKSKHSTKTKVAKPKHEGRAVAVGILSSGRVIKVERSAPRRK